MYEWYSPVRERERERKDFNNWDNFLYAEEKDKIIEKNAARISVLKKKEKRNRVICKSIEDAFVSLSGYGFVGFISPLSVVSDQILHCFRSSLCGKQALPYLEFVNLC